MPRAPHIALVTVIFLSAVTGWCTDPAFEGRRAVIFPITDLSAKGADRERQRQFIPAMEAYVDGTATVFGGSPPRPLLPAYFTRA